MRRWPGALGASAKGGRIADGLWPIAKDGNWVSYSGKVTGIFRVLGWCAAGRKVRAKGSAGRGPLGKRALTGWDRARVGDTPSVHRRYTVVARWRSKVSGTLMGWQNKRGRKSSGNGGKQERAARNGQPSRRARVTVPSSDCGRAVILGESYAPVTQAKPASAPVCAGDRWYCGGPRFFWRRGGAGMVCSWPASPAHNSLLLPHGICGVNRKALPIVSRFCCDCKIVNLVWGEASREQACQSFRQPKGEQYIQGRVRRLTTKSNPAPTMPFAPVMAQSRCPVWLMAVLLLLVTMALYWPATRCDFVNYDDPEFLTENPHVQGGLNWEGVKWAFCNTEQAAYWAPLMWLSHMLAWQFFGMNAWGHHLINVLLHAANTALVFLVLRRLTRATWRSLMVAALFGLASVAGGIGGLGDGAQGCVEHVLLDPGVVGLCESMSKLPRSGPQAPTCGTAQPLGMFMLGLMSKPALALTLPWVLLLLDYWPLGRMQKVECGMQNVEASDTQHATRNPQCVSRPAAPSQIANRKSQMLFPLLLGEAPFPCPRSGGVRHDRDRAEAGR